MDDDLIRVRMRLQDARKFIADSTASAAAVKAISNAADTTGRSVDRGNRSNFAYSQGLYTLRRGAFYATTGLLGLASAAVVMGFKFNANMESNQLVMGQFLGSAAAAKRELGSLFQLAATGPFEFTNLVSSARSFLAFGFTLKETNKDLSILSDTAAGLQLGGAGLDRLVTIFGQIKSSGRLLGNDMMQLGQAGINVRAILQRQLGLSKAQMLDLAKGTLSIPSEVAIPAIMAGLNLAPSAGGFRGLSAKLQGTFTALTATVHDYASQLFGTITHPWFLDAERSLGHLVPLLRHAGEAYKISGFNRMFGTLDKGLGANGRLVSSWRNVQAVGQDLDRIIRGALIPAFGALWVTVGLGSPPMNLLIGILGLASRHTTLLEVAIGTLAARFLYLRFATLAWRAAAVLTGSTLIEVNGASQLLVATQKLLLLWTNRSTLTMLAAARAAGLYRVALLGLSALGPITITLAIVTSNPFKRFGNWLSGETEKAAGALGPLGFLAKPLPGPGDLLGLGPKRATSNARHHVKANAPVGLDRLGATIAANINVIPANVNMDGKKVGDVVFGAASTVAARG